LRALAAKDKGDALRGLVTQGMSSNSSLISREVSLFSAIPNQPFCYWLPERLLRAYAEYPPVEARFGIRSGSVTFDDFRFLRLSWEVPLPTTTTTVGSTRQWYPISKGGAFARFYADGHLLIDWLDEGNYVAESVYLRRPREGYGWGEKGRNKTYFGNPAITWSRRSQRGFSARVLPSGSSFSDKSPTVQHAETSRLWYFLSVANSTVFAGFLQAQIAFGSYEIGAVGRSPIPAADDRASALADLARGAWSLSRSLDTRTEVAHAFVLPALLQVEGGTLAVRAGAWVEHVRNVEAELGAIQSEIDERCFDLYGIEDADRLAMTEGFGVEAEGSGVVGEAALEADEEVDEDGDAAVGGDAAALVAELVSWAVGVAFGRFDVRLATGARALPVEPEPFDPLPVCSPAMLVGDDGLPFRGAPSNYLLSFPEDGILVDDAGDSRDLVSAVHAVFETVFEADADAFWEEAAAFLDPRGHDLRLWLASGFFEHHLKLHSKSRRKAPIFWQLGTPSRRYSVWLYAHRLTEDSFFQLQNDLLAPKLAYEERQLTSLVQGSEGSPSAKERTEIAAQEAFVGELRVLLEEVKRVAPLWKPTLDDGVVLVMAPLWRLVPYQPWQRELKTKWAELADGKYDWAHLAMHLWPDRVVPICASDRSLAIAHRLEDIFWVTDEEGKWKARQTPTVAIDELVRERTSEAVKAGLRNLDTAPTPTSATRSRQPRGAKGQVL
jgi:hypothetical protein